MTSSCFPIRGWDPEGVRCQNGHGHGPPGHPWPRKNRVFLGNAIFWTTWRGWGPRRGPLQESVHEIPDGPIYAEKTTFLESKPQLSSVFCTFLGSPWTCPGNSKVDPPKKGCEVNFGRRGKLTCHRIDELFKPNCLPGASQSPRRPPRRPPGRF